MAQEIPSTSLPGGKAVMDMFEQIKSQGFEKYFGLTQQKVKEYLSQHINCEIVEFGRSNISLFKSSYGTWINWY